MAAVFLCKITEHWLVCFYSFPSEDRKSWSEFNFFPGQKGHIYFPEENTDIRTAHAHVTIFPVPFPFPFINGQVEIHLKRDLLFLLTTAYWSPYIRSFDAEGEHRRKRKKK